MTKYIKLFENYSTEEEALNAIYENVIDKLLSKGVSLDFINSRLNEQQEWEDDEDEELTSGEKAALTRGLNLMTKPQMAAIYLLAKGKVEEVGADHVKMIPGIDSFGYTDETDGDFRLTIPGLADAIGMGSDRTLSYTLSKFQNLIGGIGATQSQSLSPKLIRAHDALSQMSVSNIVAIAGDSIQDASYTVNRDAADSRRESTNLRATERRDARKAEDKTIALIIDNAVKDYQNAGIPIKQYSKVIYRNLQKDYPNIGLNRAYDAYVRYLGDVNPALYIMRPSVA